MTRRRTQAQLRSDAARRAWDTRRANELKRKRREAALKAWETRRQDS